MSISSTTTFSVVVSLLFLSFIVSGEYFSDLMNGVNPCDDDDDPRVRYSWFDYTDSQRDEYTRIVAKMKTVIIKWSTSQSGSLYDYFAEVHNRNTAYWHYSSFFLPVHRYFLWKFETALQYVAQTQTFSPPLTNKCPTVPYWPWDLDVAINGSSQNNSCLFAGGYIGPKPNSKLLNFTVPSGRFTGWIVGEAYNTFCPNSNCRTSNDAKYGPKDYLLKRLFDNSQKFKYDGATILAIIANSSTYQNFTQKWEGWHSTSHAWISFIMSSQRSPYDPIFWLHHSQIDRIFAMYLDCYDFENFDLSTFDDSDSRFYVPGCWSSKIPPGDFTLDSVLPFTLSDYDLGPFGQSFPTVREVYGLGTADERGYEGMFFRYGPDYIVSKHGYINGKAVCASNLAGWNYVNYGVSQKRQGINNDAILNRMLVAANVTVNRDKYQSLLDKLQNKVVSSNKAGLEGLHYLVQLLCPFMEKSRINQNLLTFLENNGATFETLTFLDTPCDSVSAHFCEDFQKHKWCIVGSVEEDSTYWNLHLVSVVSWSVIGVVGVVTMLLIGMIVFVVVKVSRNVVEIRSEDYNYSSL